jgi:CubicO group peptidase (beta-lactamase class C family)
MDRRQLLGGGGAALLAAWLGSACGGSEPRSPSPAAEQHEPDVYFPTGDEWETVDIDGVDDVASFLVGQSSTAFVLLVGGRIAGESYWRGSGADTARDIASCQKSVVSTLCGIAREQGLIDLDDAVSTYLGSGWAPGDDGEITVRHLLTMTSGLDPRTLRRRDRPGTKWRYNTAAYQKLRPVLEEVTGDGIEQVTRSWLFDPIGVSGHSTWGPRRSGAWALSMTARDLARLGLLVQRRGAWDGEQVVAAEWFDEALSPSQELNPRYGYLWWLTGRPGADDLVAALGARDQKLYACPSLDVVVVRQGGEASGPRFDERLIDEVLAAIR